MSFYLLVFLLGIEKELGSIYSDPVLTHHIILFQISVNIKIGHFLNILLYFCFNCLCETLKGTICV